jgi:hypothetical protein
MNGHTRRTVQAVLVLALAAGGASVAQAKQFIPGYTDFPSASRVAHQRPAFRQELTDFPSALRAPARLVAAAPIVAASESSARFDWADAGVGAGVTTATLLALAGLSVGLRRRGRVATSP